MTPARLEELFEKGQYQEILDQLALLEEKGEITALPLAGQAECAYYKSRALEGLGKHEEALRVATRFRKSLVGSNEKISDLSLLVAQLYALSRMSKLDEALATSTEGDSIVSRLSASSRSTGKEWIARITGRSTSGVVPVRTISLMEVSFYRADAPETPVRHTLCRSKTLEDIGDEGILQLFRASLPYPPPTPSPPSREKKGRRNRSRREP